MPAHEWDRRARHLEEHLGMIAERMRQDLSVLVVYARKSQEVLQEEEVKLAQLVNYSKRALKTNDTYKHFFLEFVTLLTPGMHLCECEECGRPTDKQESQPLSDYEFPFLEVEAHDDDEPVHIRDALEGLGEIDIVDFHSGSLRVSSMLVIQIHIPHSQLLMFLLIYIFIIDN